MNIKILLFAGMVLVAAATACGCANAAKSVPQNANPELTFKLGNEAFVVASTGQTEVANAPHSIHDALKTLKVVLEIPDSTITANDTAFTSGSNLDCSTSIAFVVTPTDLTKPKLTYTLVIKPYNKDSNPYGIYTAAHLGEVRNDNDKSYLLKNDISLPDISDYDTTTDPSGLKIDDYATKGWLQIDKFTGIFDGGGFHIRNLTIKRPGDYSVGLFAWLADAIVSHLSIDTSTAGVNGDEVVGILVGQQDGGVTEYITTSGKAAATDSHAGGIVGILSSSTLGPASLMDSSSSAGVSTNYRAGGIIGTIGASGGSGKVLRCYSTGNITNSGDSGNNFGGLIGGVASGSVSLCWASGTVSSAGIAGGLIGWSDGAIEKSYATGSVTSTGDKVGGLVGLSESPISNCYSTGAVSGTTNVGGLVGSIGTSSSPSHVPTLSNSWTTSTVTATASAPVKGPVFSYVAVATWVSNCYYAVPSVGTVSGITAIGSTATQSTFAGFAFGASAVWIWTAGKWPSLAGAVGAAQTLLALPAAAQ